MYQVNQKQAQSNKLTLPPIHETLNQIRKVTMQGRVMGDKKREANRNACRDKRNW